MAKAALKFVKLDDLPIFASDLEIGIAVVGLANAKHWASVTVKILEKMPGFARYDEAHGGRYVPGVKKFYEDFHAEHQPSLVGGRENPEGWKSRTPSRLKRKSPQPES
jgi:hypothetical protein